MSKEYTYMWALTNILATPEEIKTSIDDNLQTVEQQNQLEEQDAQSLSNVEIVSTKSQDKQPADQSIISVSVKADNNKRLGKQDVMPTCAATRSLLLSNTHERIT